MFVVKLIGILFANAPLLLSPLLIAFKRALVKRPGEARKFAQVLAVSLKIFYFWPFSFFIWVPNGQCLSSVCC